MTNAALCVPLAGLLAFAVARTPAFAADDLPATEAEITLEDRSFFETSVRPVLINRCQDCHSTDSPESKLSVEHLAELLTGGTRGPALVPGKPEESLLIRALSHGDVELQMPPKEKLPAAEIAALTDWVRRGAPWPGERANSQTADPSETAGSTFSDEQRNYWAFQPPVKPALPPVQNGDWIRSPIDRFVLQRLEQNGMEPAPPADKRTLIRRIYLDLLGVPPTPAEIAEFLGDDSPDAYPRLIDRCLASPHYGERWGRYWLDVARYADSNGLDENLAHAHAFRYRDYIVAALNADKPYDAFVHEQLAGDLLNADPATATTDYELASQRVTATGFLSIGAKMLAEDDPVKMQMDIIDEQVDTLGKAFMGLTFGCARCHDHKFDPLSQSDYYALAGIFKSTKTMDHFRVVARWQELPLGTPTEIEQLQAHRQKIEQQTQTIGAFTGQQNEAVLKTARAQAARYLLAAHSAEVRAKLIAGAQPQGETILAAVERPAGVQLLEAEQFSRGNVAVHSSGYGDGIGVIVNDKELPNFVEYDIEVPAAGLYQLEIRHAAAEKRPCTISLNGAVVVTDALAHFTGSWYPDTQTWTIAGFIDLRAGHNTLRIERNGPVSHIDKLLLAPASVQLASTMQADSTESDAALQTTFIDGWRRYLAGALASDSPLLPAQRAFLELPAEQWFADLPPEVAAIFPEPRPTTFATLAEQYSAILNPDGTSTETSPALAALQKVLADPQGPFKLPDAPENLYPADQQAELKSLRDELAKLEKSLPALPEAMAVTDAAPENLRIHYRGSHQNLGPEVARHFPVVFEPDTKPHALTAAGSGRLELAQWLTRSEHPLTARVMVNRVWLWHFGRGLVRSPDNFGLLGEAPTHPELLDWLALEFAEEGWSLKDLHRLILNSSAWQMSTAFRADYDSTDPENKLLWRMNRRRLDAEAIRDSILAVSGALDDTMQGTLLPTANRAYVTSTASVNPAVYDSNRRSLYLPVVRSALYEMFQAFDFADPSVQSGQRDSTTVASQALFMMNSQLVTEKSAELATAVVADSDQPESRVALLFARILGREPTADESAAALAYLHDFARTTPESSPSHTGWQSLARMLISSNEFLYVE